MASDRGKALRQVRQHAHAWGAVQGVSAVRMIGVRSRGLVDLVNNLYYTN